MKPAIDLDEIDRKIITELQTDGRITNVELARRVKISAPPCLRRVRRLEDDGVIRGYHADIDPIIMGWPITFFAFVGLSTQSETALRSFEKEVSQWPELQECHMIRGGSDFLLRLVARNITHENTLTRKLTEGEYVSRVQTFQTVHSVRDQRILPE